MVEEYLKTIANGKNEEAEEALRMLYINYGSRILSYANRILNDRQCAEEVLNDILLKVWKKAKFLSSLDQPLAYITTMTYNLAIDYKRKKKEVIVDDINIYLNNEVTFEFEKTSSSLKLDRALEALTEIERTIIILKDGYDCTFYEIAEACKISYKQARNKYLKAFNFLKNSFEKWEK